MKKKISKNMAKQLVQCFSKAFRTGSVTHLLLLAAFLFSGMLLQGQTNTWYGSTDTDWHKATNWSLNHEPFAYENVNIPNVGNDPVITTAAVAKSVTVNSGAVLLITGNAADLTVNGASSNGFKNSGTVTVDNSGSLLVKNTGSHGIYNTGSFNIRNGASVTIENVGNSSRGFYNYGTLTNEATFTSTGEATGYFSIGNSSLCNNTGAMIFPSLGIPGALSLYVFQGTFNNWGTITFGTAGYAGESAIGVNGTFNHNGGLITIDNTGHGIRMLGGNFNNNATITIGENIAMSNNELLRTTGALFGLFRNKTGGRLNGSGAIPANNFANEGGTLSPGYSTGIQTFNASEDFSSSILEIEFDATGTAGDDYDQIVVSGQATLGGTAVLNVTNTNTPGNGDQMLVLDAASLVGGFSGSSNLNGWFFNYDYPSAGDVTLSYGAPLQGCHDNDGDGYEDETCGGDDCDDNNAAVYPGATEVCDGFDNNCDGNVDEGCTAGEALGFDGVNDYVNLNSPILSTTNGSQPYTVEMWIKAIPGGTLPGILFGQYNAGDPNRFGLLIQPNGHFFMFKGGMIPAEGTTNLKDNTWHHVAMTKENSGTVTLYVDGQVEATSMDVLPFTNFNSRLGNQNWDGGSAHFNGNMDEVRIWDHALCEAEVQGRMNCELAGSEPGLIAYYNFNKGVAGGNNAGVNTLPDESGNGYHGSLINFALSGSNSNWVAPGAVATGTFCGPPVSCNAAPDCTNAAIADQTAGANCSATINGNMVTGVTDPDLDVLTITVNPTTLSLGANTVTVTASDGNGGICNTTITVDVVDNTSPTANCPSPPTLSNDAGQCGADVNFTIPAPDDNCPGATSSVSHASGSFFNVGTTVVTVTAMDAAGNTDQCTFNVVVNDTEVPTPVCKTTTVAIQPDGSYTLQESDVFDAIASTDNCGVDDVSFPAATYECAHDNQNFIIPVSVTDASNNTASCNASITVKIGDALPGGWTASDIGNSGTMGNSTSFDPCATTTPSAGDFVITGGGNNATSSTTDNVAFAGQTVCGDGTITAKIESISAGGYGGLMIRETTTAGSKQVAVFSNMSSILRHEARYTTNGPKQVSSFFKPNPIWLRLQRQGNWVFAYYSTTGVAYQYVHAVMVSMQSCVEFGLASFTYLPGQQTNATFSNVSITGASGPNAQVPTITEEATSRQQLSLYPNPTRGIANLVFEDGLSEDATVTLRNQLGQVVEQRELRAGDYNTEWNVSALADGLYLFEIRQEGKAVQVLRLVKTQ